MPRLRPVDYDPFESAPEAAQAPGVRLRAVDYDPFASQELRHPDGRLTEAGWQAERDELAARDPWEGVGPYRQYLAGVGSSISRAGRGVRQLLTAAAAALPEHPAFGVPREIRQQEAQRLREREAQLQREQAPLRQSRAYQFGDLVGSAAQLLIPGAAAARTPLAGTLLPTTMRGNMLLGGAAGAAQPVAEGENRLANLALGTAAGGAGHALGSAVARWTPAAREAMRDANRLGVNLRGAPGEQVHQLSDAARGLVPDSRGDAMIGIQQGLRTARDAARQEVNAAYDAARGATATVPMQEVRGLAGSARRALDDAGFDVGAMPGVARRLEELDQLAATPNARAAQLRALEQWRRRINAMSPKDGSPEMAASSALKRQYDDFMTDLFNRDMIGGDPAAVGAWRDARAASSRFHATFNADRVVRNLATMDDLTPETMRQYLFNVGGSGAKSQAGQVVKRLNEILGPDSPQMAGLRAEVVADLSDPLLRRTPNIEGFLDRYDTYFKRNPTLIRELFPEGAGDLQQLQMFARGIAKRPGAKIIREGDPASRQMFGSLQRLLTAKMFGHGIAEGGARMAAARGMIDRLRAGSVGSAARKNILREYLGADSRQPMFPTGGGQAATAATNVDRAPLEIDIVGGTPVPPHEFDQAVGW